MELYPTHVKSLSLYVDSSDSSRKTRVSTQGFSKETGSQTCRSLFLRPLTCCCSSVKHSFLQTQKISNPDLFPTISSLPNTHTVRPIFPKLLVKGRTASRCFIQQDKLNVDSAVMLQAGLDEGKRQEKRVIEMTRGDIFPKSLKCSYFIAEMQLLCLLFS